MTRYRTALILRLLPLAWLWLPLAPALAAEELITSAHYPNGEPIPYILNTRAPSPAYVLILFPGGDGNVNPRIVDGKLAYNFGGNFLVRSRKHFLDDAFATVTTNSTQSKERIQGLLDDLGRRFPRAQVYLIGTSNGTFDTMELAGYLSGRVAGIVHTASLRKIATFDTRQYKIRQLIVHHRDDGCHATPFSAAEAAHENYGAELIVMEGGISTGNPCEARGHHGFNGIEAQTATAIKNWIKKGQ